MVMLLNGSRRNYCGRGTSDTVTPVTLPPIDSVPVASQGQGVVAGLRRSGARARQKQVDPASNLMSESEFNVTGPPKVEVTPPPACSAPLSVCAGAVNRYRFVSIIVGPD